MKARPKVVIHNHYARPAHDNWYHDSQVNGYYILRGTVGDEGRWLVRNGKYDIVKTASSKSEAVSFAKQNKNGGAAQEQQQIAADASGVRIVQNKLLGGWFVVRGPQQTPISGRFPSKEAAEEWLKSRGSGAKDANEQSALKRKLSELHKLRVTHERQTGEGNLKEALRTEQQMLQVEADIKRLGGKVPEDFDGNDRVARTRDATVEGKVVKVGDVVGFKSDHEQYGRITAINGDKLTLYNPNGFGGDYLRYAKTTVEYAQDCWLS